MKPNESKSPEITKSRNIILVIVFCLLLLLLQRCKRRVKFEPKGVKNAPIFTASEPAKIFDIEFLLIRRPICYNSATGNIFPILKNGVGPYTVQWKKNGSTAGISSSTSLIRFFNFSRGLWELTVTDSLGNVATKQYDLQPIDPSVMMPTGGTTVNSSGIGGSTGSISTVWGGGTAPYSYQAYSSVNGGTFLGTSNSYTNLARGHYRIFVKDAVGCANWITFFVRDAGDTFSVAINQMNQINTSLSHNYLSPTTTQTTVEAWNSTSNIFTYLWNDGNTSQIRYNLPVGTYSVTVTHTPSGATRTESITIVTPPITTLLNISVTNTTLGLANGQILITSIAGAKGDLLEYYCYNQTTGKYYPYNQLAPGTYLITAFTDMEEDISRASVVVI